MFNGSRSTKIRATNTVSMMDIQFLVQRMGKHLMEAVGLIFLWCNALLAGEKSKGQIRLCYGR